MEQRKGTKKKKNQADQMLPAFEVRDFLRLRAKQDTLIMFPYSLFSSFFSPFFLISVGKILFVKTKKHVKSTNRANEEEKV